MKYINNMNDTQTTNSELQYDEDIFVFTPTFVPNMIPHILETEKSIKSKITILDFNK